MVTDDFQCLRLFLHINTQQITKVNLRLRQINSNLFKKLPFHEDIFSEFISTNILLIKFNNNEFRKFLLML